MLPRKRKIKTTARSLQHANAFGYDFAPNPISLDYRYPVVFQFPLAVQFDFKITYCKAQSELLHLVSFRAFAPAQSLDGLSIPATPRTRCNPEIFRPLRHSSWGW